MRQLNVRVEFGFGSSVLTKLNLITWTDVTPYIASATTRRGRSNWLDHFPAGEASIVLRYTDDIFTPTITTGPYAGNINVGIPMRISILDGMHVIFTGYVDSWTPELQPGGEQFCVVAASDVLKVLSNIPIPGYSVARPAEGIGTRVSWLMPSWCPFVVRDAGYVRPFGVPYGIQFADRYFLYAGIVATFWGTPSAEGFGLAGTGSHLSIGTVSGLPMFNNNSGHSLQAQTVSGDVLTYLRSLCRVEVMAAMSNFFYLVSVFCDRQGRVVARGASESTISTNPQNTPRWASGGSSPTILGYRHITNNAEGQPSGVFEADEVTLALDEQNYYNQVTIRDTTGAASPTGSSPAGPGVLRNLDISAPALPLASRANSIQTLTQSSALRMISATLRPGMGDSALIDILGDLELGDVLFPMIVLPTTTIIPPPADPLSTGHYIHIGSIEWSFQPGNDVTCTLGWGRA